MGAERTFSTDARPSSSFQGRIERLFTPPFLCRVYRPELENLADYAQRPNSKSKSGIVGARNVNSILT